MLYYLSIVGGSGDVYFNKIISFLSSFISEKNLYIKRVLIAYKIVTIFDICHEGLIK